MEWTIYAEKHSACQEDTLVIEWALKYPQARPHEHLLFEPGKHLFTFRRMRALTSAATTRR